MTEEEREDRRRQLLARRAEIAGGGRAAGDALRNPPPGAPRNAQQAGQQIGQWLNTDQPRPRLTPRQQAVVDREDAQNAAFMQTWRTELANPERWRERAEIAPMMGEHGASIGSTDEGAGLSAALLTSDNPILQRLGAAPHLNQALRLAAGPIGVAYETIVGEQNTPDAYRGARDEMRGQIQQARQEFPVTSLGSEIFGGSGYAAFGAPKRGLTILQNALRTMPPAAAIAGLFGFNATEGDLGDRGESAVANAAIATVAAPVLGYGVARLLGPGDPSSATILNATLDRPVSPQAARAVERVVADAGVPRDRVMTALAGLNNRIQAGADGPALPTRLKDFLIDEFPEATQHINSFLRGVGVRGPRSGGDDLTAALREDSERARAFFREASDARLGGEARGTMDDAAQEALGNITRQYEQVFTIPPAIGSDVGDLRRVIDFYRGSDLMTPLRQIAQGQMIDLDDFIATDPRRAAHWMQNAARTRGDELEQAGQNALARAYNAMRDNILQRLEAPGIAPGYREARLAYGTESGFQQALTFGRRFIARSRDDLDFRNMAREYEALTPYQQEAALASIRDAFVTQAMAGTRAGGNPRMTQVASENAIAGLRQMLGQRGDDFARDIEGIAARIANNSDINPAVNSRTARNLYDAQDVANVTSGPVGNALRNVLGSGARDVALSAGISAATGNTTILPYHMARGAARGLGGLLQNRADRRLRDATQLLLQDVTPQPRNALVAGGPTPPPTAAAAPIASGGGSSGGGAPLPTEPTSTGSPYIGRRSFRMGREPAPDTFTPDPDAPVRGAGFTGRRAPEVEAAQRAGYAGADTGEAAEWLAARAKGLDMSQEARMARAVEQGFDTSQVLYHGTDTKFTEFNANGRDPGVWMTTQMNTAASYASPDGDLHYLFVRQKRPLIVNADWVGGDIVLSSKSEAIDPDWDSVEAVIHARSRGYDSVIFPQGNRTEDGYTVVIFDPSNIRSVNAAFDPDNAGSANLLAGAGGLLGAGALLTAGYSASQQEPPRNALRQ